MAHSRFPVFTAVLVAAAAWSAASFAAPVRDISVSLSTEKTAIDATQDVVVEVSITNNANHPVHVLKW